MEPAGIAGIGVIVMTVVVVVALIVAAVRDARAARESRRRHEDGTAHEWIRSQTTSEHHCGWTYCMCQVWECSVCYLTDTIEVGCDEVR